jgi:hypothetical protein
MWFVMAGIGAIIISICLLAVHIVDDRITVRYGHRRYDRESNRLNM